MSTDASDGAPLRILYVAGWGRSGSTLVSRILGRIDGYAWVGELKLLWERSFEHDTLCGCGVPFSECRFWREVFENAWGRAVDPAEGFEFKHRYLRARYALPVLDRRVRARLARDPAALAHLGALGRLHRGLAKRLGARVLIDSSKAPGYADVLDAIPGLEVRLLHLVRDPRGVAYSSRRWRRREPDRPGETARWMQRYTPFQTALFWDLWNSGAERLAQRRELPYLRVRYEDFAERPREVVGAIAAFAGATDAPLPLVDDRTVELEAEHSNFGNPIRFETGRIGIRADDEWRESMALHQRLLIAAVTLPLLRRYGYSVRA